MIEKIKFILINIANNLFYVNILSTMAKVCPVTNKSSIVGGGYSNRTRATQFNPTGMKRKYANLQKKRIFIPELNKNLTLTLSTRAIKTIQKHGAFATLKKAGVI
jgi:large subunit ribosomal protein L28